MDPSYLNQLTVSQAAEILAARQLASATVGGLVKRSDVGSTVSGWGTKLMEMLKNLKGNVTEGAKGIWNAKPDLASAQQSNNMGQYWKDTSGEALRNALLGGGIGGGIGALKGIFSDEEDDTLSSMLSGGLAGAGIGGAGTALYRGGASLLGDSPGAVQAANKAQADQNEYSSATKRLLGQNGNQPGHFTETLPQAATAVGRGELGDAKNLALAGTRKGFVGRALSGENILNENGNNAFGTLEGAAAGGGLGYTGGKAFQRGGIQNVLADKGSRDQLSLATDPTDAAKQQAATASRTARAADPRMKQIGNQIGTIKGQQQLATTAGNKARIGTLGKDLAKAEQSLAARRTALTVNPVSQAHRAAQVPPTKFWSLKPQNYSYSKQLGGPAAPQLKKRIVSQMPWLRRKAPGLGAGIGSLMGTILGSANSSDYNY